MLWIFSEKNFAIKIVRKNEIIPEIKTVAIIRVRIFGEMFGRIF